MPSSSRGRSPTSEESRSTNRRRTTPRHRTRRSRRRLIVTPNVRAGAGRGCSRSCVVDARPILPSRRVRFADVAKDLRGPGGPTAAAAVRQDRPTCPPRSRKLVYPFGGSTTHPSVTRRSGPMAYVRMSADAHRGRLPPPIGVVRPTVGARSDQIDVDECPAGWRTRFEVPQPGSEFVGLRPQRGRGST